MELLVSGSVVSNLRFFWEGENGIVTLLKKSQYALFSFFYNKDTAPSLGSDVDFSWV